MKIPFRKSEAEKWAEAKLDPNRNARAQHGKLTADQIVARQTKATDATNKRRGK